MQRVKIAFIVCYLFAVLCYWATGCSVRKDIQVHEVSLRLTKIDTLKRYDARDLVIVTWVDTDRNKYTWMVSYNFYKVGDYHKFLLPR